MTEDQTILIQLLAQTDALWLPVRSHVRPGIVNVSFGRKLFHEAGMPWRNATQNNIRRVQIGRLLDAMQESGMLTIIRGNIKFPLVKLTDEGERQARVLAGLPPLTDALSILDAMVDRSTDPLTWVSEHILSLDDNGEGTIDQLDLLTVENMSLPALCRGWLESHSDVRGHVRYRATAAGLDALAKWDRNDEGRPEADPEADRFYETTLKAALSSLATDSPEDAREIGPVPLNCSMPWNGEPPWTYEAARQAIQAGRTTKTATVRN